MPVLKAHDARMDQTRMDHFLSFSQRFAKIKSSRLQVCCCCTHISGVNFGRARFIEIDKKRHQQLDICPNARLSAVAVCASAMLRTYQVLPI